MKTRNRSSIELGSHPTHIHNRPQFGLELGLEALERDPFRAHIFRGEPRFLLDGEGDGNGGGGGAPPRTFSQEEVNAIVAKESKKLEARFGDYEDLKTKAAQVDDLAKKLETIEEEAKLKGLNEAEKERHRLEKQLAGFKQQLESLTQERDQAQQLAEQERSARRTTIVRHQVMGAMQASKVVSGALDDAVDAMLRDAEVETDDSGQITSVSVAGGTFNGAQEAAAAYLKTKPYFASHPGGGSGNTGPNGGPAPDDLQSMSNADLAELAGKQALGISS